MQHLYHLFHQRHICGRGKKECGVIILGEFTKQTEVQNSSWVIIFNKIIMIKTNIHSQKSQLLAEDVIKGNHP